jgi:RNA-directed DNA polymerase
MDPMTALHTGMNRQGASQWVRDADSKGCFDKIDHSAWLARLPLVTTTLRRWWKAGVVERGHSTPTEAGTPQGGVVSPLRATMALDGMERLFDGAETRGTPQRPSWQTGQNKGLSRMRDADDLVVVAPSREVLEQHVLPTLAAFLRGRGLQRSEAKTRMVQSTAGLNFVGCEIKRYKRARLTPPQKAQVYGHYRTMKTYLKQHKQSPAAQSIRGLNPHMRGWANYDRHGAAKRACRKMDHLVWHARWKWAKRRHPKKPAPGVHQRYFRTVGNRQGVFAAGKAQILWYQDTPMSRRPKVKGKASPMNPDRKTYWEQRGQWRLQTRTSAKQRKSRLQAQDCRWGLCTTLLYSGDPIDDHHSKPKQQGGEDRKENRMLGHQWCHHAHHQRHGYKAAGA